MDTEGINIRALTELFKSPDDESSDSDEDLPASGLFKLGPGQIGNKSAKPTTNERNFKVKTLAGGDIPDSDESQRIATKETYVPDEFDIWREDEVVNKTAGQERWDPREQPEYDIKYRQAVTTEDVYLQMGCKSTSTASCEDMVVTIYLEGEKNRKVIDLTLTRTQLDIRSPLYRLSLHLPHPIDPEAGNAVWNKDEHTLVVTLRMVRELDLVNF